MYKNHSTPCGIIEGFFGRAWSWEDRKNYAQFLAQHQYDFYIYAPKSDKNLRREWQQDWPADVKNLLIELRQVYSHKQVSFGVGLSPHEIYLDNSRDQRAHLINRIRDINELQPDILCILFDDMRGDIPKLAQIQIDIAHQAAEISTAKKIIFCPTYYSFDPVLEKVFGQMPADYWHTFSRNLDSGIDIFWTGEKVCSPNYSVEHLATVTELLGRKPFLWDNYPVNDSAIKSNLLQLRAFDQSHSLLNGKLAGHAVNPMNQPWLSQLPLASLPFAYRNPQTYNPTLAFTHIATTLCGEELARQLEQDLYLLQDQGLKKLTDNQKTELRARYQQFANSHYAQEIIDWLDGKYEFDPACLTD
ncbi:beta-N-acetylglucosaminidase domain-containing protein [Cellvibrio sp. UBA7661]|uniref:beta-N-acetylglucosaminidase domain-containing protein n=1 Tax=Cellvibrio sp. UBA7661 TaxID=1946311 RepID=UPI002F359B40